MRARSLWTSLAVIGAVIVMSGDLAAQTYPTRPVKIIVPTPAGGPIDTMARVVARYLSPTLGQNVVIDNRGGAGNTIGSAEVARAPADGYTLLFSSASGLVISPMLYKNPGYDPIKSYAPIAATTDISLVLVVNPGVPAKSVQELVSYAKANPGKLNFASGGSGTLPHLTGELLKAMAGIDIVHIPYKGGGPGLTDTVAGQTQLMFDVPATVLPFVQDNRLRLLAVAGAKRDPSLPDVPTMIESGFPGFVSSSWTALLAPAGTPADILKTLNAKLNEALQSAEMRDALTKLRATPIGGAPQVLTKMISDDTQRWGPIVKKLDLKAD
jgi:tripartite-type tricarboxylate transporter receptor subunit TctC